METFPLLYIQVTFTTALVWVWEAVMPYLIASFFFLGWQLTTKMKSVSISESIQAFVKNPIHLSLEVGKVQYSS